MSYEKPIMEILKLEIENVVRTSIDDGNGDNKTPVGGGSWV